MSAQRGGATYSPHIMVVDEHKSGTALRAYLASRGFDAIAVPDADDAVQLYDRRRPSAVVLDLDSASASSRLRALDALRRIDRDVPIIVLSAAGMSTTVVQAMKLGAASFVSKPFNDEEFEHHLTDALYHRQTARELAALREQFESNAYQMVFGESERMREIAALIDRVADTSETVLIRGERGTGKELLARAIATSSSRSDKPFVNVRCADLAADLLDIELFGVERGIPGSGGHQKPGRIEFASHGTLFLDEIWGVGLPAQAKLIHFLQDGEFSRAGGTTPVRVDVRVIASTSRDLDTAVAEGQFRNDLFFRLNVIAIHLPALRERRSDIPVLAEHFLKKHSARHNRRVRRIAPDLLRLLMEHDWPGNIRELEQVIERAVVVGSDAQVARELAQTLAEGREPAPAAAGDAVTETVPRTGPRDREARTGPVATSLPPLTEAAADTDSARFSLKGISREAARQAERELILGVLQRTRWNRKAAAAILGISYKALLYKIKENGLDQAP